MSTMEATSQSSAQDAPGLHTANAKIDADIAKRLANRFILENLPDRFCAGTPRFLQFPMRTFWAVPVVLSYPRIGPVGQTGILAVDTETGSVVGWTPLDEMKEVAQAIYAEKKAAIEAAFSQTRNA